MQQKSEYSYWKLFYVDFETNNLQEYCYLFQK